LGWGKLDTIVHYHEKDWIFVYGLIIIV